MTLTITSFVFYNDGFSNEDFSNEDFNSEVLFLLNLTAFEINNF